MLVYMGTYMVRTLEEVILHRSWKARYSHFLKRESKYPIFRFSLILIEKSLNFYIVFTAQFDSTFRSCTKAHCLSTKIWWSIQFHIVKNITKILKSHFLKNDFFQISSFLKYQHNSVSFWARELREDSLDSEFLTDHHTGRNAMTFSNVRTHKLFDIFQKL